MKLLELFAGSRSWGKIAEELGYEVFSVDHKPFEGIDLVIDIEDLIEDMLPWIPDVVIDGRPCTTYSMAAISHHRYEDGKPKTDFAAKCDRMNIKLNNFYKNWDCIYYIENPRAMLRKMDFMKGMDRTTVTYCSYGDTRMKPTDIFSNNIFDLFNEKGWKPKGMCWNGNKKCQHEPAPRGSRTGTQGLKGNYERSKVPQELCYDILKQTLCLKKKKIKIHKMSKKKYKILNLYSSLGGNRKKWDEIADNIEVTAVELDPELARMYKEMYPNDIVVVTDAHQYLLDHYKEFDFIWSSPPCPTHSKAMLYNTKIKPRYSDMKLYQEIIFLQSYFNGKYCVENVIPYYEPLMPAKKRGRHLYWTNFNLPNKLSNRKGGLISGKDEVRKLCEFHDIDISNYKGEQRKDKIARNLVDYEAGKTIFETALGIIRKEDINQKTLF